MRVTPLHGNPDLYVNRDMGSPPNSTVHEYASTSLRNLNSDAVAFVVRAVQSLPLACKAPCFVKTLDRERRRTSLST